MIAQQFVSEDLIRQQFAQAMSDMYRNEVPDYGVLIELVEDVNRAVFDGATHDSIERVCQERHGAIRVGDANELSLLRRAFALMGMFPVGYYDLSVAGLPVHSTAFRPVTAKALEANPFRLFTSLLRVDLIEDPELTTLIESTIKRRQIVSDAALSLIELGEHQGGLTAAQILEFVPAILETFQWHANAHVLLEEYQQLMESHRLVADIVSFKGPHINHLTPRTLDITQSQIEMPKRGISAKAVIEGPPSRQCPILLRQTSFKSIEETVHFMNRDRQRVLATHTARFGEIEQRGVALTPKGMRLYHSTLDKVRATILPNTDGTNADEYMACLANEFQVFPDSWAELRTAELAYFEYALSAQADSQLVHYDSADIAHLNLDELVDVKILSYAPITYEDFLPVSAAGIFQSNLNPGEEGHFDGQANQAMFEQALGCSVQDYFELYAAQQADSITQCRQVLAHKLNLPILGDKHTPKKLRPIL